MNLLYKPVDTESIKREIQSAQTVIELLLLMAAEKEAEGKSEGKVEPVQREMKTATGTRMVWVNKFTGQILPRDLIPNAGKAVGDAAAAVGKAAGSAGKAVGDAAKGLLETDQEKFQKALDSTQALRETFGTPEQPKEIDRNTLATLEVMDRIANRQIKRDKDLEAKITQFNGSFNALQRMVEMGGSTPEQFETGGGNILNAMAELTAKSLEDNPSLADKAKKAIKGLPNQLEKANDDLKKAFVDGPMKLINQANAAFQVASEERKKQITDFQDRSLEMFSSQKKKILDELGANTQPARQAFDTLVNVAKGVNQEVGVRVRKVKEKGKELIKNTPLKDVEAVGAVAGAVAGAVTFGGIAGAIFFSAAYGGLAAGVGVAALGGLAGLPPMTAATAALATQMCVTFAADLALMLKTDAFGKAEAVEKKVNKAVQDFYKDLQAAMEKKREEESSDQEPKEVSAAALDYLGYILGY